MRFKVIVICEGNHKGLSVDGSSRGSDIEKLTTKATSYEPNIAFCNFLNIVHGFKKVESCFVLYIYAGY